MKLIVEELIDAPIDKVWNALTNKNEMKQWYFDLEAFNPKVGFEFTFPGEGHTGTKYIHLCKITEIILHKRLQYSWQYENYKGYSLVTFDLQEEDGKTRLILTHSGLESFPQNNPDFGAESFKGGWTQLLTKFLPEYLAKDTKSI